MKMSRNTKEWLIAIAVLVPIVAFFVMIVQWLDGAFQGTIMQELAPAILFGAVVGWITILIITNFFSSSPAVFLTAGGLTATITIILYMFPSKDAFLVIMIATCVIAALAVICNFLFRK